jgi:hypothetical protein
MDTLAIMGFMNSLMDVIKREKTRLSYGCLDNGGANWEMKFSWNIKRNVTLTEAIK